MSRIGVKDNHLALEPYLIARITDMVPDLDEVGGYVALGIAGRKGGPFPAAYVLYLGDTDALAQEGQRRFNERRIGQRWQVVLRVKPTLQEYDNDIASAGAMLTKLLGAVSGWTPGRDVERFARIETGESQVIFDDAQIHFVETFETDIYLT